MKKIVTCLLLATLSAATAWAIPANPKWLSQLAQDGDTATLRRVYQRHARIQHKARRISAAATTASPLNIAQRGLIILVNFSDLSYRPENTHAEMDSMINGRNYTRDYSYKYGSTTYHVQASGSVRRYFQDASAGAYNPIFDVVGPVTLSKGYAYYGANDIYGDDKNATLMIKEACQLAKNQGVDFRQYDNDGDGYVDFVYVFYAGKNESDGAGDNYIWPHSYELEADRISLTLDGKKVNRYACSGELEYYSGKHDGIGTFCHEFSHVLGLPDLYETTGNGTWKTMGEWDVMDYGPYNNEGNTPPTYSGYERWFMGWTTPQLLNSASTDTLHNLATSNHCYILTTSGTCSGTGNDPNPSTFYILENRQQSGWDAYLPGHGMMMTKVAYSYNKWSENTVNNSKSAMGVDLVEADGSAPAYSQSNSGNGYFGKPGDLFPAGATSSSKVTGYPISDIREQNGVITFRLMGGGSQQPTDTTTVVRPSTGVQTYRKVTSEPTSWAGEYLIVYEKGNLIMDGSLSVLDVASNTQTVQISGSEIQADSKYAFVIRGSQANYTLQSKSGYYVGGLQEVKNGLLSSQTDSYSLSIAMDGTDVDIECNDFGQFLRYNTTQGQYRFRFFKAATYTNQQAIQLYRLVENSTDVAVEREPQAARMELRRGQIRIVRDGRAYSILGHRL